MHPPRLLFLGLDGLPWSLAKQLCGQGLCPNLATLVDTPKCRAIQSELPELSPVNWTSLFTASPPGRHGVFGFTRLHPRTYTLEFTDFTHVHGPTIFDRMGAHGLFSKVVNLPNLAPVRPARGLLVAGFPAQSLTDSVHPPVLASILADLNYTIEADTIRGSHDPALLLDELHRTLACRQRALDLFWPDLAWDLFMIVLTETDRLGHFLFPALIEAHHPWRSECLRFMAAWDRLIGNILCRYAALPEPKRLIVMADHGFTTLDTEVDLNVWLQEQGLLVLTRTPRNEWDAGAIAPETRAFALDPGRIYLHTRERFGRGKLTRHEAERLGGELESALRGLTINGRTVIRHAHRATSLHTGPQAHQAPDLTLVPQPGFDLKGKFGRTALSGHFGRQGMHTADDVFHYDSTGAPAKTPTDVGVAILEYFGITASTLDLI